MKDALDSLESIIEKKIEKDYFTCNFCSEKAVGSTVQCETCLCWFHMNCVEGNMSKINKNDPWFCCDC